jgi:hypothetical protein
VKRLTFLAVVIAEAVGMLAGRRGFALRFAGEAAVAAAVAVLEAVARRARQNGQRRSPIFLARGFPRDDWFDAGEREEGAGQSR